MSVNRLCNLLVLLAVSCFMSSAWAQSGTVNGLVTDPTGAPIGGVEVRALGSSGTSNDGGVFSLRGVRQSERVLVTFSKEGYATTFGIVDLMASASGGGGSGPGAGDDLDGDGLRDAVDACPKSNTRSRVRIDRTNTDVDNVLAGDGCTAQDSIFHCSKDAAKSGDRLESKLRRQGQKSKKIRQQRASHERSQFRSCVRKFARELRKDGLIRKRDENELARVSKRIKDIPVRSASGQNLNSGGSSGGGGTSPAVATLTQVMLPLGTVQTIDADDGGVVEQDGFRVTFPPDSIDATGDVQVILTPIDVSTAALVGAFPGDFEALDASGDQVLLETFSLMNVDLLQSGRPVELMQGASVELEFLLPPNTSLRRGDTIPLWFFNEDQGIWIEEGSARVDTSVGQLVGLSAFGNVSHFSWWNCDQPITTQTSISGQVVDSSGNPVAGARVKASGVDYTGTSYATSDADGNYCANVRINSSVNVTGSLVIDGVALETTSLNGRATGNVNLRCQDGGAQMVPNLVVAGLSCVSGLVQNADGTPLEGALVRSSNGGFATTDETGQYCLAAAAGREVTIFASGLDSVRVNTPDAEASCADGNCAVAPIITAPDATSTACLIGRLEFEGEVSEPVSDAIVQAFDFEGEPVGPEVVSSRTGNYCLAGLPLNLDVTIQARDAFIFGEVGLDCPAAVGNTGATPSSCLVPGSCAQIEHELCEESRVIAF